MASLGYNELSGIPVGSLGDVSIWRCHLSNIGSFIIKRRRSHDHVIFIMEIPILERSSLYWDRALVFSCKKIIVSSGALRSRINSLRLDNAYLRHLPMSTWMKIIKRVHKIRFVSTWIWCCVPRHQVITWTHADLLAIEPLGTNFSEILIDIHIFSSMKMYLKTLFGSCCSFCLHYSDIIMSVMASQITGISIVCSVNFFQWISKKASKLCSTGLCEGNHRSPVVPLTKGQ